MLLNRGACSIWSGIGRPAPARAVVVEGDRVSQREIAWREAILLRMVVVHRQADLLEVIGALVRRAASRADCTAGSRSAIRTEMMAMTTRSSMSAKPRRRMFGDTPGEVWTRHADSLERVRRAA